ncbi:MAG: peptidylprolyl isomerase, partial [Thermodesulfobacteriota bacterium]|nr:peptidylprolyl isomerase [Thermodesulfobacteriota bacterium]
DVMLKNKLIIKDDEIQDYYEIHRHEFVMGAKVRLQNILFTITASATEDEIKTVYEKAEKVLELIKSGADFGELAKLYSDGPAAQLGGDLGYFTQDELMDDMGRWAFTLKEGEVSEIIKSPLGFNIIKVLEKIYDKVRPLDEVKEEIRSRLFSIKLEKRYEEWIEGLKRQTAIEIMM